MEGTAKLSNRTKMVFLIMGFPAILLAGFAPLIISFATGYVASLFGIKLDEGSAPDIPIIGSILYTLYTMVWYIFLTLPAAVFGLIGYTVFFVMRTSRVSKN